MKSLIFEDMLTKNIDDAQCNYGNHIYSTIYFVAWNITKQTYKYILCCNFVFPFYCLVLPSYVVLCVIVFYWLCYFNCIALWFNVSCF